VIKVFLKHLLITKDKFARLEDLNASQKGADPYDQFDYFMNLSDKIQTKSIFFILSLNQTKRDGIYSLDNPKIKTIINNIKLRGHIIGIHSGFYSYNNKNIWQKEYDAIKTNLNFAIKYGRQHYLNFNIPKTWQIQEDCGLKKDFSMGYESKEGFRCGTCKEFRVFNILTRKKLKLKEVPLIVMVSTFVSYQKISPDKMYRKMKKLILETKKYRGNFVFLWHNSCVTGKPWNKYTPIFEKLILEEGK